jgi:hypothetical protein
MRYRHIKQYKYEVEKQYVHNVVNIIGEAHTEYVTLKDGILKIRKGYCWNGASGPVPDNNGNMRASLVHDVLYQLMRMGEISQSNKPIADELLGDIMLDDGASHVTVKLFWWGVKYFGFRSSKRQPRKEPPIIDTSKE